MLRSELDRIMTLIDAKQFTALSLGIGLGELRQINKAGNGPGAAADRGAAVGSRPMGPRFQQQLQQEQQADTGSPAVSAAWSPLERPAAAPGVPTSQPRFGAARTSWSRRLLAWSLDFLMVTVTLVVAVAAAALVSAVRTGETENPMALAPVQWLMATKPTLILAGVYAIFLAYGLIFKLLAGLTLGESLLRVRRRAVPTAAR